MGSTNLLRQRIIFFDRSLGVNMTSRLALAWMLRLAFALVLAVSGIGKLLDRHEASRLILMLTNSNPVVEQRADRLIVGLSIFEIALAGSLLHHRSVRIGLIILSGILVLFSGALGMVLVRGMSLDSCGCFGAVSGEISLEIALLRNLLLLTAALACYLLLVSAPPVDENIHPQSYRDAILGNRACRYLTNRSVAVRT